MWVNQFWEFREDFHHLVGTLTTGSDNHDVCLSLLRDSVLQHRLTRTERTWDEARTAFHDGVECVNRAHTCLQQLEGAWFLLIVRHGKLHWPVLHHIHLHLSAVLLLEHSHHIVNLIFAGSHDALHLCLALHLEGSHNFQFLRVFFHLTEPCRAFHLIAHFGEWHEVPFTFFVEGFRVLTTLQEDTFHLVEVVLQTVVVLRQHARTQLHFQHVSCKFGWRTNPESTC